MAMRMAVIVMMIVAMVVPAGAIVVVMMVVVVVMMPMIMIVVMIVPMMIMTMRRDMLRIGAALGIERGLDFLHLRAQAARHVGDHMVAPDAQLAA